jgi:hypothetical protein
LFDNLSTLRNQIKLTYSGLNLLTGSLTFPNSVGTKIKYYGTSYYSEVQASIFRTVVSGDAGHYFMCGTTDEVIIDVNKTTFNNHIFQGDTNFIYQTGTGDNYLKNIVQNDYNAITHNG